LGSGGNMIMNNNLNYNINNQPIINHNNQMANQGSGYGVMANPMYQGGGQVSGMYGGSYTPVVGYGYNMPMPLINDMYSNPMGNYIQPMYNPGHLINQPPLNNYNRNIFGNPGIQQQNQPVKLYPESNSRLDTDIKSKRALSSKHRVTDNSHLSNNQYGNNMYPYGMNPYGYPMPYNNMGYGYNNNPYNQQQFEAPHTNPDSFSKNRGASNNDGVFKPYTLKDYKEISAAKIVMGSLGPNIGTKEWEEKNEKMKKMEEYANRLKKNKIDFKLKKEEPSEIIEREKKEKIEKSTRHRTHEYAKLVRPRSKIRLENDNSYLPNINNNNNESDFKIAAYDNNIGTNNYNSGANNISNNLNSRYDHITQQQSYNNSPSNNIEQLKNRRDIIKYQIDEIKDSLLK
jgi:hypothetical protein